MRIPLIAMLIFLAPTILAAQQPSAAAPTVASNSSTTDAQIDANAVAALGVSNALTGVALNTTTVNGVVTLTGTVKSQSQKELAEMLVGRATGVKSVSVVNQLTIGTPQPSCDANNLLSDGTCGTGNATPASATAPTSAPEAPMMQVDVDEKCHVAEQGKNGGALHYQRDDSTCSMKRPRPKQVFGHTAVAENGALKRVSFEIDEQTYFLHNGTQTTIMYLVHIPLRNDWQFDSDPQPATMATNVGTWHVVVQPGQTIPLHVGQKHLR
jgi:hypothetical protein